MIPRAPSNKVVLWDFDGTLVWREGLWRSALVEALDRCLPGHQVAADDLRPLLRDGVPWHRPERPHPELSDPARWWECVGRVLGRAFEAVGAPPDRVPELVAAARTAFLDPERHTVFADTRPALEALAARGWRHVILSNHVPELEQLVTGLGLRPHFDCVLTSALTGHEKPHPQAFACALERAARPEQVWMVGDNVEADVAGAERVGIPAILTRREGEARFRAADLWEVVALLTRHEGAGTIGAA